MHRFPDAPGRDFWQLSAISITLTLIVALMALFGWAIGDYLLVSVDADRAPMQVTTALCFLCFVAHILARTASITTLSRLSLIACVAIALGDRLYWSTTGMLDSYQNVGRGPMSGASILLFAVSAMAFGVMCKTRQAGLSAVLHAGVAIVAAVNIVTILISSQGGATEVLFSGMSLLTSIGFFAVSATEVFRLVTLLLQRRRHLQKIALFAGCFCALTPLPILTESFIHEANDAAIVRFQNSLAEGVA